MTRVARGETVDLAGAPREVLLDGVAASLSLPGASDPQFITFAARATGAERRIE
jgi:hypothetical protein